jgi:hypothetical protein
MTSGCGLAEALRTFTARVCRDFSCGRLLYDFNPMGRMEEARQMNDDSERPREDSSQTSTAHADTSEESRATADLDVPAEVSPGERWAFRRLTQILRFTDFMTLMMVVATGFSAFATWRTAQVTNLLFSVAERPYMGVEQVTVDGTDGQFARVVVDCRNFGQVQATGGVAQIGVTVDGKPLPQTSRVSEIQNIGIVSPTVPHRIFHFVPIDLFNQVRAARARMIVNVNFTYRGPDQRPFCYSKLFSYDSRSADFIPTGGTDKCSGEVY